MRRRSEGGSKALCIWITSVHFRELGRKSVCVYSFDGLKL